MADRAMAPRPGDGSVLALRPFLIGLVVLNVVFVQITQAVDALWLLPLYGLTLACPLLVRLQDSLVYRGIWNLAVLAIFAVLVRHALTSGLLHMLEDGLILAALCQVHLINNLGPRQRPDLLFFNSFLIAFVTSFFCQDLAFSVVFAVYVLLLVPSLQLYCVGSRTTGAGRAGTLPVRAVLRDSAPRTALALGVTAALFAFFPRDFQREGWIGAYLDLHRVRNLAVGFSEEVQLGRSGETTLSDREVMRIRVLDGHRGSVPSHWRGATFVDFDASGWTAEAEVNGGRSASLDPPWRRLDDGRWQRQNGPSLATLEVRLTETLTHRLFVPLQAGRLQVLDPEVAEEVLPLADGTVLQVRDRPRSGPITYRVALTRDDRPPPALSSLFLGRRLRALHPGFLPPELLQLAARLDAELPREPDQAALVEKYRSWLAENLDYKLPGTKGAATDLGEFVAGDAGGHCEYFATALAFMLRSRKVPCRLVTGFLASEWDEERQEVVVRRRHAHAWVEVFDPVSGWVTADATPAADEVEEAPGFWAGVLATVEDWWDSVTGFDAERRAAVMAWLRAFPGRAAAFFAARPAAGLALALLLALLLLAGRRLQQAGTPPAARALRRSARRLGLRPLPGETPRELLERAAGLSPPPRRLAALQHAIAAHETARYSPRLKSAGEMRGLPDATRL